MSLERTILEVLADQEGLLVPERTVFSDANLRLATTVTQTECNRALQSLEAKRQVIGLSTEDAGTKWKITGAGRARLAE